MSDAKILLVEDETDVLSINRKFLERQGFITIAATTVAEARLRLRESPDLILLDIMLPDGDGLEFAREIREFTSAPIVFLSCLDDSESVIKGLMSGGDDYITKPYDLNVLLARVFAVLRRAGFDFAGVIEVPPLTIDMLSGMATLGTHRVHLSPREIQLLACLAKQAGRCVKCSDIYKRVWGEPVEGFERTISVYITYLRQKLNLKENGLFEIRSTSEQEYILSKLTN